MRVGAHVSMEGSFAEAPRRAAELGCDCFQIFAGPPRNWRRRRPSPGEADEFRELVQRHDLWPVAVHAGYLLHLVSRKPRVAQASKGLLLRELEIASLLGADYYFLHLGGTGDSHRKVIDAAARILSGLPSDAPEILLENSAHGRDSGVGSRFEDLGEILDRLVGGPRCGVCFDTAHAVGAGYDLGSPGAVRRALKDLFGAIGRARTRLVHANDSRAPVGSSRDLHEAIGRGEIGREGFKAIIADRRLSRLPFIIETPVRRPGDDRRNLSLIRRLASRKGGRP